jgi:hypothetical protein
VNSLAFIRLFRFAPFFPSAFVIFLSWLLLTATCIMSDPRFARLKTDPRFRRPRKHQSKVVVDERFKEIFDEKPKKNTKGKRSASGSTFSSHLGMLTDM